MARPDRLAKRLVSACLELHRRRSWNRVPPDAPFLIRVPTEAEPLAAVLIGQNGEELGLVLTPGPDALEKLWRSLLSGAARGVATDSVELLNVSFERLGVIPEDLRGVLQDAGFRARREVLAPMLLFKPAFHRPRRVHRAHMRTLVWCLEAIFAAEDRGELRPEPVRPSRRNGRVLQLEVAGELRAPDVSVRVVAWAAPAAPAGTSVQALQLLPADLGELPRTAERWVVGLAALPGRIEGDDRTLYGLPILDEVSDQIVGTGIVPGGDAGRAVSVLVDTLRERGLPRAITFIDEGLLDSVAPGLAAIGVRSQLDPEHGAWSGLAEALTEAFAPEAPPPADPRTLEDWKRAELDFTQRFVGRVLESGSLTPRALKRYFGSEQVAAEVQRELQQLSVTPALVEWLAADYRATRRSRTFVEKELVRKQLAPLDRVFLDARRAARVSIFRVTATAPGASFDVEDVLDGERFTVHDRALSMADIEGLFLPLRLMRIGKWTFPCVAGPPLGPMLVDRFLDALESSGSTLTHESLRSNGHLLGRAWSWELERRERPPVLRNTDGDLLELVSTEFQVKDPGSLAAALEGRDDVIVDEPGAEWTWVRQGGPGGFGDSTTLARLELIHDALLVETNSARRAKRARDWLEELARVRFVGERSTSPFAPEERPLDDRLPSAPPAPLPPEVRAELERMLEEHTARWLDESLPALDGLTPREACATPQGRKRVARLIRTKPDVQTPGGGIPAPRERLLRELGL